MPKIVPSVASEPSAPTTRDAPKRSAGQAHFELNTDRDRWARPRLSAAPIQPAWVGARRSDEEPSDLIPTPSSFGHGSPDAGTPIDISPMGLQLPVARCPAIQAAAATSTAPPPLGAKPGAQASLAKLEQRLFRESSAFPILAQRIDHCLWAWLSCTFGKLDIDAAERVVRALGAQDQASHEDTAMMESHLLLALTRTVFGDTVPPKLRSHWGGAMRIGTSDALIREAAWQQRTDIAACISALREATNAIAQRDALSKVFLVVAASPHVVRESPRAFPPLSAMQKFLSRHASFNMAYGDFAMLALNDQSIPWLQAIDWETLANLADGIIGLGEDGAHARRLLQGVLKLTSSNIEQVACLMATLCAGNEKLGPSSGADAGTAKKIKQAYFSAIEALGYDAVKGCRNLFVSNFDPGQRLAIVTALSRCDHPDEALLTTQLLRSALVCKRHFLYRPEVVNLLTQLAGPSHPARCTDLQNIKLSCSQDRWVSALERLAREGYTGETLADLAAAEALLRGTVTSRDIVFVQGNHTWRTPQTNIPILMMAARLWASFGCFPEDADAGLAGGAGAAIVAGGPAFVRLLCSAGNNIRSRLAYAAALGNVPLPSVSTYLQRLTDLAQQLNVPLPAQQRLAEQAVKVIAYGAADVAVALARPRLQFANPRVINDPERILAAVFPWALQIQPLVPALERFAAQNRSATLNLVGFYCLRFASHMQDVVPRLTRLLEAFSEWPISEGDRFLCLLLDVDLRVGEALPRFAQRAQAAGVAPQTVADILGPLARMPADGVRARMALAGAQTDAALAQLAAARTLEQGRAVFTQVILESQARLGNEENVHDAVRIRATDAALDFLRNLDGGINTLNGSQWVAEITTFICQIETRGPSNSIWLRRRTASSRTTLENALYVLDGPYHPGHDLSRSVNEVPDLAQVCALVWRAIDLYRHPSGRPELTAQEQRQMREDVVLGLAECVRDENGFRFCSVGFKQRVIGALQGDERYPEILVDAVNAAQLLTVVGQHFAISLEGRDPSRERIQAFLESSRELARARFANEPSEIAKFQADLDAWVAMDYNYEAAA